MSKYLIDRLTKSEKYIISAGGNGTKFGMRNVPEVGLKNNYHIGNDYNTPEGTKLYAPTDGEFLLTRRVGNASDYGNQIFFYSPNYNATFHLAHLNDIAHLEGKAIKEGDYIGTTGNTGLSSGPHLHLGVAPGKKTDTLKGKLGDGTWINPSTFYITKEASKLNENIDRWRNEGGVYQLNTTVIERSKPDTSGTYIKAHPKGTKLNYVAWGNSQKYTWFKLENGNYIAFGERGVENYGVIQTKAIAPEPVAPKPVAPSKNKPTGAWKNESGVFILGTAVYERNEPDTSNNTGLKKLPSGTKVPYDAYLVKGGYVWLRKVTDGKVIPWRIYKGEKWGKVI